MYIPGTTCLHIPLAHSCLYYYLLSPQYTVLHILFYCTFYSLFFLIIFILYLYLYIFSSVVLHFLHYPLSGPDLTYISLLIISCIIEYVTNKQTLNLEPWTCEGAEDLCWSYSPMAWVRDKFHSLDVRTIPGYDSAWAEAFLGSQLSQVRQARWYTIRWCQCSIKVTYEGEHLGYVCNHGSLNRERYLW